MSAACTGGGGGSGGGGGDELTGADDFPPLLHPSIGIPKQSSIKTRCLDIILTLFIIIVLILYTEFWLIENRLMRNHVVIRSDTCPYDIMFERRETKFTSSWVRLLRCDKIKGKVRYSPNSGHLKSLKKIRH